MAALRALALAASLSAAAPTVQQIRAAYVTDAPGPFVSVDSDSGIVFGFAVDLLNSALARLNATSGGDTFALSVYPAPDGQFGALNATSGQWSGVIGEVVRGEADLGLGDITWSAARDRAVQFTGPWLAAPLALLTKPGLSSVGFSWGWTEPFSTQLWWCVLGMTALFAALLAAAERLSPYSFRNLGDAGRDASRALNAQESVTRALGNLVGQGPWGSDASSWSTRIIVFAMAFFTLIVGTQYSGGITSSATVRRAAAGVAGLSDLAARGAPWGALAGSFSVTYVTTARDAPTRALARTLREYPDYTSLFGALRAGDVLAVLDDGPLLAFIAAQQPACDFAVVPVAAGGWYSFPARNGSAFGRALQTAVLELLNDGTIDALVERYGLAGECAPRAALASAALQVADLAGVFIAALGLCALAFVVLAAERAAWAARRGGSAGRRINKCCGDHGDEGRGGSGGGGGGGERDDAVNAVDNPIGAKRAAEWAR
jgi:ABC-type amino acid transport substrate-binding protein